MKTHVFKGKTERILTRAWASQLCNVNQAHLKGQVAKATLKAAFPRLTIPRRNGILLWMDTWSGALMHATDQGIPPNLLQAGSTLAYRALTKPCAPCQPVAWLDHDKAWAPGCPWTVINAGGRGQELHALKISFRERLNGSVGGWQHRRQYRMNHPAQRGSVGSYWLGVLWAADMGDLQEPSMCWDPRILWFRY